MRKKILAELCGRGYHQNMQILFFLLMGVFHSAEAAQKMQFTYEVVEGAEPSKCKHEQIQDLPDWRVYCDTPYGKKVFTAHVIVREVPRKESTSLEMLYWVTEPGVSEKASSQFHSTTALIRLKGSTSLTSFSVSQGVENDFASLLLDWSRETD